MRSNQLIQDESAAMSGSGREPLQERTVMGDDRTALMTYSREDSYQRSFWLRSCIVRPMPRGKRVYLVLLQFILYEIVSYSTELYLAHIFSAYLIDQDYQEQLESENRVVSERVPAIFLLLRSLHLLFCLPMGFLADRYFGRTKVLIYSWIFLFVTQSLLTIHVAVFEAYTFDYLNNAAFIAVTILVCTVHAAGLAGVHVNLIPYGIDQLTGAFADECSSYFHWYYWCRSAGVFFVCTFSTYLLGVVSAAYVLLIATVSCTIALLINLLGRGWFTKADKVGNPLLLIFSVLRHATMVKKPVERSAFSYDGRPEPSRLDLVKKTHFGSFKDEEVEDVKVFLRILGILSSLVGFFCVSFLLYSVYLKQALHLKFSQDGHLIDSHVSLCNQTQTRDEYILHISPQWCLSISTLTIMILIPILDRIFYPMPCCQWVGTMLNRITAGMFFSMLSIVCALALEVWRHHVTEVTKIANVVKYPDYLHSQDFTAYYFASDVSVYAIVPQFLFQGVAEVLSLVTIVEFIYAQSPGQMKGVLLGCLFSTEGFAMLLGALLFVVLSQIDSSVFRTFNICYSEDLCSCSDDDNGFAIGLYAVVVVIALISFVMFRYAVRKYVVRKRDRDQKYFTM